jgi:preprotein translocase subunit SecY
MTLSDFFRNIPQIKNPPGDLGLADRIKWTIVIALVFLFLDLVPLPILEPWNFHSYWLDLNISILLIGLGPIFTVVMIMQILLRLKVLKLDLGKTEDRLLFYGLQKTLILCLALFESLVFVVGYGLASGIAGIIITTSMLSLGVLILLYLDEIVVKWGIGSGFGLFIAIQSLKYFFTKLFLADFWGTSGILVKFFDYWINRGIFEIGLITPLITAALIAAATIILFKRKTVFEVKTESVSGTFSMNSFYVSTLAGYGSAYALFSMIFRQEGQSHSLTGLLLPKNWPMLSDNSHLGIILLATSTALIITFALSYLFARLYGLDKLYTQPSRNIKIDIKGEKKKDMIDNLKRMIITSSLIVMFMSLSTDLLGSLLSFTLIMLTVGYLYRCSEEIKGPIKTCPVCGSQSIEWLLPSIWSIWECRDCGYRGIIAIESGKQRLNNPVGDIIKWLKHAY